jgi:MFS family permease
MGKCLSLEDRSDLLTAVVVACSLLGDSFLYVGLPLTYKTLGLNLVSVGMLLSVNRFIRFFSNTWASYIYDKHGIKLPFFIAICVGTLTTLCYSLLTGFIPFLLARVVWGVSWSFLRIPGYLYASNVPLAQRGKRMGLYQSISVIGSLCGTLIGGLLLDLWDFRSVIYFLTCASAIGIPIAFSLNDVLQLEDAPRVQISMNLKLIFGDFKMFGIGLVTAMNGLLIGSILSSTLSLYLLEFVGEGGISIFEITFGIATLSSFLLAMRRISRLALGPFVGSMSDFLGRQKTLIILFSGGIISMALLGLSPSISVVVLAVLLAFVSSNALGIVLATEASDLAAIHVEGRLYIISSYVNWIDLGTAMGPLIAYILRLGVPFRTMYLGASVTLFAVAIFHLYAMQR